ncbi:MAG: methionyl-tRNA formyltransferase [Chryseobacterium sp.]|nr:MAG: methionyl-tRNA formyltransferase [Chryseobacterium sp.]
MKSLKVVFFGTPEFAAASLGAIHKSKHQVVGVVTVADKASGRGLKIQQSAVKKYAAENGLQIFQPLKLRDPDFLREMESLQADVFVVVAFRMMPKVLYSIPAFGTFNLHASLLPDYRGAAPINYAVINGEERTGVTTFFINEKIDEGNLLLQAETSIEENESAGELHDRLMAIGADLVVQTLDALADDGVQEKPQPVVENPKNAFKIFKEDTLIDWQKDVEQLHNFIRGMSPYPAAYTHLKVGDETKTLKIFKGSYERNDHDFPVGEIAIEDGRVKVYANGGMYYPEELQLEGKRRMTVRDFLNGLHQQISLL